MTIDQAFQTALGHHQAGNLDAAGQIYRQILAVDPRHADSLHLLGVLATQRQDYARAVDLIGQAIALNPQAAHYHSNLGEAHRRAGQLDLAIPCFHRAIALHSDYPDAATNLGLALLAQRKPAEALPLFQRVVERLPTRASAHANLGDALAGLDRRVDAAAAYRRALALDPRCVSALNNLGNFHLFDGRLDDAQAAYLAAAQADPQDTVALQNLGALLVRRRNFPDARQVYERFLQQHPDSAAALAGLAGVCRETVHIDEALALYRRAIALAPDDPFLHANLATTLRDAGFHAEALAAFDSALALGAAEPSILSAYILTLYLFPDTTQATVDRQKALWDQRFAQPLRADARFLQPPDPQRRLRIGYVSPDLRIHPVGRFMLPLIRAHDPAAVEVTCYATSPAVDAYTSAIRAAVENAAGRWRACDTLDDARLAALIRDDQIDVLVDLSMHAVGNRLLVFARRPAPVQISYLAYADSAGLSAIDAHLADAALAEAPAHSRPCDRPLILPRTYWCYAPHAAAPDVAALPALSGHPFTFGCLNHFAKLTRPAIAAWATLLRRVSGSRLLLHVPPGESRALVLRRFADENTPPAAIEFVPTTGLDEYLAAHHRIDVALDPFPYAGGTTTCDALWMGVPVVSLAGPPDAPGTARAGLSILRTVGLERLVARTVDAYVDVATALAEDLPALAGLRASLRERLRRSPLTDVPAFARDIEAACRSLWREFCSRQCAP